MKLEFSVNSRSLTTLLRKLFDESLSCNIGWWHVIFRQRGGRRLTNTPPSQSCWTHTQRRVRTIPFATLTILCCFSHTRCFFKPSSWFSSTEIDALLDSSLSLRDEPSRKWVSLIHTTMKLNVTYLQGLSNHLGECKTHAHLLFIY